jgi:nitronate monooxygenase
MSASVEKLLRELRYPVVQASMADCDGVRLAAAVSKAGGLGTLSLAAPTQIVTKIRLERLRALTQRAVLLALTAEWEHESILECCLTQGFRHFQVFWWNGPRLAERIHAAGGQFFWQIGTLGQLQDALAHRADGVVVVGTAAGGPVRSPNALLEFVARVRQQTTLPIIAGGGLGDRSDTNAVLAAGADAALFGTRFLLSEEATAPLRHKRRLLIASSEDLLLDPRLIGEWPCDPRRRLPTETEPDAISLYAGLGLGKINQILPAAEIVRRLSN